MFRDFGFRGLGISGLAFRGFGCSRQAHQDGHRSQQMFVRPPATQFRVSQNWGGVVEGLGASPN